jgi:hypothetical protein
MFATGSSHLAPASGEQLPGLGADINVPANSVMIISTNGGVSLIGLAAGVATVDIWVTVDGTILENGGLRTLVVLNPANVINSAIAYWSIEFSIVLTPGSHSIAVFAHNNSNNLSVQVSGGGTYGGILTLTTLKR